MNFKIATSLLIATSLAKECLALRGGDQQAGPRGQGQQQGSGSRPDGAPHGGDGRGRPFSGGPNGDMPGFPGIEFELELTDITCSADYSCALPNGEDGTFVCRQLYQPITGEINTNSICIPNDRAWVTDGCGCCDEDCPEQPDFSEITCEEDDGTAISRAGDYTPPFAGEDVDVEIVCRNLVNPFTGEEMRTTIPIPASRGLDGDTCGCCDGVCPEPGEERFPRPDSVDVTCDVAEDLITCDLPRRKGKDGATEEDDGVFVCREIFNPRTGVSEQEALCIPSDRAWATDECGCCGGECPELPMSVEIECEEVEQGCEMRNGEEGVFVCRSLFHPIDRQIEDRSMCIPSDRAWVTDTCGCCDSECPTAPEGGFADEDTQLLAAALEAPTEFAFDEANGTSESGASVVTHGGAMMFVALFAPFIF